MTDKLLYIYKHSILVRLPFTNTWFRLKKGGISDVIQMSDMWLTFTN